MNTVRPTTKLSELLVVSRVAADRFGADRSVPETMLRSIQQSMHVEGVEMSREHVIASAQQHYSVRTPR